MAKHLIEETLIEPLKHTHLNQYLRNEVFDSDMSDIQGQEQAKRAMEIAAAEDIISY